jgi:hypothetical protein
MRRFSRLRVSLGLGLALAAVVDAAEVPGQLEWRDSARDVWIDGKLDRDTQVLTCSKPRRMALVSPKLSRVAVVDLETSTVSAADRSAFRFAKDRASAKSDPDLPSSVIRKVDGSTTLQSQMRSRASPS